MEETSNRKQDNRRSLWYAYGIPSRDSNTARNGIRLINGDCLKVLESFDTNSIDTCITDPPYELGFMGKSWDKEGIAFDPDTWRHVLRVLKPGASLLCFGGTRTFHHLTSAIEDAGFQIRDCMMWLFAQGLPKSYNLRMPLWRGWGTGLKPAWEPIVVAMKPLDGTFERSAGKWGVAGFNIDGGRIASATNSAGQGRWPANVIFDEEAARMLDEQSGILTSGKPQGIRRAINRVYGRFPQGTPITGYGDSGGASRFFYCAKASRSERGDGNDHPTVKPLKIMEYLCRLTRTPSGGIVLDPFLGSGTTALACLNTARPCIGIEKDRRYFQIAKTRLASIVSSND